MHWLLIIFSVFQLMAEIIVVWRCCTADNLYLDKRYVSARWGIIVFSILLFVGLRWWFYEISFR